MMRRGVKFAKFGVLLIQLKNCNSVNSGVILIITSEVPAFETGVEIDAFPLRKMRHVDILGHWRQ